MERRRDPLGAGGEQELAQERGGADRALGVVLVEVVERHRLPAEAETTLYRIAQEALTNVAKHARAEHVEIILERRADNVLLIVEDDGVGFDPGSPGGAGQGFGLLGMQERAALVGATLEIESSAGKGTTVLVRMAAAGAAAAAGSDHV